MTVVEERPAPAGQALAHLVVVVRRGADTLACLQAIEDHAGDRPYVASLVADGADAEAEQILTMVEGDASIVRHDSPRGVARSWSEAAGAARAENGTGFVVLLDDTIVVRAGWLDALIAALDADPQLAAVQPMVLDAGGRVAEAGVVVLDDGEPRPYRVGSRPDAPMVACNRVADGTYHGCLVVRADAYRVAGGLDAGYATARYAGTDLLLRLQDAGWRTAYVAGASVTALAAPPEGTEAEADRARFVHAHRDRLRAIPAMSRNDLDHWVHRPRNGLGPGETGTLDERPQRILVVDPWSPTFDRDTGHLRLTQMITCLRAAGHHVTYDAIQCFDRAKYAAALAPLGVPLLGVEPSEIAPEVLDRSLLPVFAPPLELVLARGRFDTVVFSYFHTAEGRLPVVRQRLPQATVVVDSVDVHYLRESRMAATAGDDPELAAKAEETRTRELAVYRAADRVVCVTQDDADELRPQLHGVELAIVPCVYDDVPMGPAFAERDTVLFIGSALHNANPDAVAWWAEEIGPRLAERLPGVPLTVVGYDPNGTFEALAGPNVRVIGAVPSVLPYLHAARVSVAPLRFGAGMKGKVIEAMMAGLPVVGTTIAMEGIGVEPGVHGEVADDPDAFADAVARVYRDAARWDAMRGAARELVTANFGMDRMRAALPAAISPRHWRRR